MQLLSASADHARVTLAGPRVTPAGMLRVALLLLVITQLGAIPVFDIGSRKAPIFVNDVLVLAVIGVAAISRAGARSLKLNDVAMAAIVFACIGGLSALAAIPRFGFTFLETAASLAYLGRWIVYFAIYLVVINCVRAGDIGRLWSALEASMLLFAAFGVFQSAFLPNFGQMLHPDAIPYLELDPQGHRLMSTMLEPNIAAAMIFLVLLVQLAQLAYGVEVPRWKPALMLVALVLTVSRSGALGFLVGLLVIMLQRGLGTKLYRFLLVMFVLALAALPQLLAFADLYKKLGVTDNSAMARVLTWQRAFSVFAEHPWFGIGFNTYGFVQLRRGQELFGSAGYSAEGGLLFVAVMTGLVGLAVFVLMLYFAWRRCRALWRHPAATPELRGLALGTAAATVGVLVHSTFVNSILVPFVMEPLWVLWGLSFVALWELRRRASPVTPPS